MREFLLTLLLGKTIILTPSPVELTGDWLEIRLDAPLEAVTSGANIGVDVYEVTEGERDIERLDELFPPGVIVAKMISKEGDEIVLTNVSAYSFGENSTWILLVGKKPVPTRIEFVTVFLRSEVEIEKVKVIWRNYRK